MTYNFGNWEVLHGGAAWLGSLEDHSPIFVFFFSVALVGSFSQKKQPKYSHDCVSLNARSTQKFNSKIIL